MINEAFTGIVFAKNDIPGIEFCNLGKELSLRMQDFFANKNMLPCMVEEFLSEIITDFTFTNADGLKYLALDNIAILFEPDFGVNMDSFIDKASKGVCLFIKSDHKAENNAYFPFPDNKNYYIDLTNRPLRQIGYPVEK